MALDCYNYYSLANTADGARSHCSFNPTSLSSIKMRRVPTEELFFKCEFQSRFYWYFQISTGQIYLYLYDDITM